MKSPKALKLTLMLGAAATLTACGSDEPQIFTDVQQCVQAGFAADRCEGAFKEAADLHAKTAPRYNSKEECERGVDVDACVLTSVKRDDGSVAEIFVPAMAGYIVGNLMADKRRDEYQGSSGGGGGGFRYYGGSYYNSGPIYGSRDYSGGYRDLRELSTSRQTRSAPSMIGTSSSSTTKVGFPSNSGRPANVSTTTISRQGFGSSSFKFGGGLS